MPRSCRDKADRLSTLLKDRGSSPSRSRRFGPADHGSELCVHSDCSRGAQTRNFGAGADALSDYCSEHAKQDDKTKRRDLRAMAALWTAILRSHGWWAVENLGDYTTETPASTGKADIDWSKIPREQRKAYREHLLRVWNASLATR